MKALSVRAPWWWAILHAGKDIENRDWYTSQRGQVLIHASKWWKWEEVCDAFDDIRLIRERQGIAPTETGITGRILQQSCGCIVGAVEIVDCVENSLSPWMQGRHGFVLRNPVAFRVPIPYPGKLGFFEIPNVLASQVPEMRQAPECGQE